MGLDMVKSYHWTVSAIYQNYVNVGKFMFFLQKNLTLFVSNPHLNGYASNDNNDCSNVCWCDGLFAGVAFVMTASYEMQRVFITIAFGICSITIWMATNDFCLFVEILCNIEETSNQRNTAKVRMIIGAFHELRQLTDSCNAVWQSICFWHVMDSILWLSMDLDATVKTTDWFAKIHIFYLLFYSAVAVILSAEADRKVGYFSC